MADERFWVEDRNTSSLRSLLVEPSAYLLSRARLHEGAYAVAIMKVIEQLHEKDRAAVQLVAL